MMLRIVNVCALATVVPPSDMILPHMEPIRISIIPPTNTDDGSDTEYEDEVKQLPSPIAKKKPRLIPTPSKGQEEVPLNKRIEWFNSLPPKIKKRVFARCYMTTTKTPLKMYPKIREELTLYTRQHSDALDWWNDTTKTFNARLLTKIRYTILILHPNVLMPLCKVEDATIREKLIMKILEFDDLDKEAKSDFKINIPGLNEQTSQHIEEIIKTDYTASSTSAASDSSDTNKETPSTSARKKAKKVLRHHYHKAPAKKSPQCENSDSDTEDEV